MNLLNFLINMTFAFTKISLNIFWVTKYRFKRINNEFQLKQVIFSR